MSITKAQWRERALAAEAKLAQLDHANVQLRTQVTVFERESRLLRAQAQAMIQAAQRVVQYFANEERDQARFAGLELEENEAPAAATARAKSRRAAPTRMIELEYKS